MKPQAFYSLIQLPPEITRKLECINQTGLLARYEKELTEMTKPKTAADACRELARLLGEDPGHLKMLFCQLECARRTAEQYESLGISWQIYIDTMKCFTRFLLECREKNGAMFFDRGWWTYRQISMTLFRIGSLEYELCGTGEEPVVGIHIPSDAYLSPSSVEQSLKKARNFLEICFPDFSSCKYTCDSWLLSPSLKPLLAPDSNILSFQKRFRILRENQNDKEFIEWLFRRPKDVDYKTLPEHTSLQRKVKALLLQGGTVGSAEGILKPIGIKTSIFM